MQVALDFDIRAAIGKGEQPAQWHVGQQTLPPVSIGGVVPSQRRDVDETCSPFLLDVRATSYNVVGKSVRVST